MNETGHAQIFAADMWLAALGVVVGAGLGYLAWSWFGRLGWPCAFLAGAAGLLAAFICRTVGHWMGPGDFDQRLANAQPSGSALIRVELTSHTPVYLAVWAAMALLPVVIAASLAPTVADHRGWERLDRPRPKQREGESVEPTG
jgi:hypothetical protein